MRPGLARVSLSLLYQQGGDSQRTGATGLEFPAAELRLQAEVGGTPGERLLVLVREFVESRRRPDFYLLLDQVLRSEHAPDTLRALVRQRSQEMQDILRQLIIEAQATGEVAAGNPEQLARAIFACVDGLLQWAAHPPENYQEHFPDAEIFLRMLKPTRRPDMEKTN